MSSKHKRYYAAHRDEILKKKKEKLRKQKQLKNVFTFTDEQLQMLCEAVTEDEQHFFIYKPTMGVYCDKQLLFVLKNI